VHRATLRTVPIAGHSLSGARLPALEHGVFGMLLVTSLYISHAGSQVPAA
jgi:hypothetical protein